MSETSRWAADRLLTSTSPIIVGAALTAADQVPADLTLGVAPDRASAEATLRSGPAPARAAVAKVITDPDLQAIAARDTAQVVRLALHANPALDPAAAQTLRARMVASGHPAQVAAVLGHVDDDTAHAALTALPEDAINDVVAGNADRISPTLAERLNADGVVDTHRLARAVYATDKANTVWSWLTVRQAGLQLLTYQRGTLTHAAMDWLAAHGMPDRSLAAVHHHTFADGDVADRWIDSVDPAVTPDAAPAVTRTALGVAISMLPSEAAWGDDPDHWAWAAFARIATIVPDMAANQLRPGRNLRPWTATSLATVITYLTRHDYAVRVADTVLYGTAAAGLSDDDFGHLADMVQFINIDRRCADGIAALPPHRIDMVLTRLTDGAKATLVANEHVTDPALLRRIVTGLPVDLLTDADDDATSAAVTQVVTDLVGEDANAITHLIALIGRFPDNTLPELARLAVEIGNPDRRPGAAATLARMQADADAVNQLFQLA